MSIAVVKPPQSTPFRKRERRFTLGGMGVFDFVKNGVREMMIARPDNLKHLIVYKHPDQNFPFWSQLTVDSDECAVFFKALCRSAGI